MNLLKSLLAIPILSAAVHAAPVDLSGEWRFALDAGDLGIRVQPDQWRFPDRIQLPGMATAQGFGDAPSMKTKWTGEGWRYPELFKEWQGAENFKFPFFLQPPRHYVGPGWYQREFEITPEWSGKRALLHLERVHWQSVVWVDGIEAGRCDSLGTPHEFDLGTLSAGKHTLTLRIDNRISPINPGPLSHSVTDHTQGNWNGVVGKIELRPVAGLRLGDVRVFPSFAGRSIRIETSAIGTGDGKVTAKVRYLGPLRDAFETPPITAALVEGKVTMQIPLGGDARPWNEFTPHLYQTEITLDSTAGTDIRKVNIGFRDIGKTDGRLAINGVPIFLRGTLECAIFPLTGHPPTDVDSWRRIVRICKAHGLNHLRFHSWCPPEAAFTAADEAGFYYQVEVSSWANQGAEIGSGRPLDDWLENETLRMLACYGNHPSFLLMAYGNEPAGKNHAKWLQKWVARRKNQDPRRFYTTGAGWTIMPGSDFHSSPDPRLQAWGAGLKSIINSEPPRTDFDFSAFVKKHSDAPIISHEIGQWCAYPDFEEIPKYTGYFKARNFEIFRETAKRNGLLAQAKDFLMASGKLQTLCYKHDIEAALRTPGFGGYQLLDLHDFPGQGTALVGVLNAFWDSKGYVSAEEYARFSGPVVPLAEMKKMIWQNHETFEAKLLLSHFGPDSLEDIEPAWKLSDGETVIGQGLLSARDLAKGKLHALGHVSVPLGKVKSATCLKFTVGARGKSFSNEWNIHVYPNATEETVPARVRLTGELAEALAALENGESVIWTPAASAVADDPARPLTAGFSPIFWNTAWTEWQPPHTLGILCDPKHPALAKFPTEFHSDWQWSELQESSRPFILTDHHELRPLVQIIDDWVTNRKLGYVFEAKVGNGKLLACSFDLESKKPVARQMRKSLLAYAASDDFDPGIAMSAEQLSALVKPLEVIHGIRRITR